MKIAINSQNQKTIFGHAGKASRYLVYTVDTEAKEIIDKQFLELAKEDILHNRFHESPDPWAPHPIFDVEIVITGGAGPGFVNRLASQNTSVIITTETDPDLAVVKFLDGTLPQIVPNHHKHH
jgi:predicted Fe-Mo cluster-binding NifX family protein